MIEVTNLLKSYKTGEIELTVLKGLSFTVPTGQFLAITGRSGSGKSTLLYQLGLLDKANQGDIIIDNVNVSAFDDTKRITFRRDTLGFIFQDYAILPMLTALENVILPMLMQGIDVSDAQKKGEDALTKVGLSDRLHNLPSQLSGGQQQRVSIARAIAHKPKILFADEPTANLDSESSEVILDIFSNLHKEGQTIIMVTHEQEFAKRAERTIQLRDGIIVSDTLHKKKKS